MEQQCDFSTPQVARHRPDLAQDRPTLTDAEAVPPVGHRGKRVFFILAVKRRVMYWVKKPPPKSSIRDPECKQMFKNTYQLRYSHMHSHKVPQPPTVVAQLIPTGIFQNGGGGRETEGATDIPRTESAAVAPVSAVCSRDRGLHFIGGRPLLVLTPRGPEAMAEIVTPADHVRSVIRSAR